MNDGEPQPLLSRALPIGKTRQTDFINDYPHVADDAPKGQWAVSPGRRPGYIGGAIPALQGQKNDFCKDSFALSGRSLPSKYTQGAAPGWLLLAFQAVLSGKCG